MSRYMRIEFSLLAILAFSMMGCGDESVPGAPPGADFDKYLLGLPTWTEFSPTLPDEDLATGDTVTDSEIIEGTEYNCTSTPYSITQTPDQIVTLNPDTEILWPGVLLQGKGHTQGIGSLAELPIRQRAPLAISIDLLTNENTRTVQSPDLASVTQAVGQLIQAASDAGHTAGSSISFKQETSHSVLEAAVRMGFSASYYDVGVQASLETSASMASTTITAAFVQRMFTVSTVLPQTPGEFFDASFSRGNLQDQVKRGRIGEDNLPVFVSNVVYGRMMIFSFTSTASEVEIKSTLSAIYNGGEFSADLSVEQRAVLDNAEIGLVAVGGDAENALALIRDNNLGSYFNQDSPLTSARPISYTIRNLGDNSIARVSETTEYNLQQCLPAAVEVTGHTYRILLESIHFKKGALGVICGVCTDPVSFKYNVSIERDTGTCLAVDENFAQAFCEGDRIQLDRSGVCAEETLDGHPYMEVKLHYDGRDSVRLFGTYRAQLGGLFNKWDWSRRWNGRIPTGKGTLPARRICNELLGTYIQMNLKFNVQILNDLTD